MIWKICTRALLLLFVQCAFLLGTVSANDRTIYLTKVEGAINPVSSAFIVNSIEAAEAAGAQCVIIQLDTPGGLDASMRDVVKRMLNTPVPMVVYVAPSGARAASAGVMITMAAHKAAMAPGTNIGAAHPVSLGGEKMDETMVKKVENDAVAYIQGIAARRNRNVQWAEKAVRESASVDAQTALKLKVIDYVSASLPELLGQLDGQAIEIDGEKRVLFTKDAPVKEITMGLRERILFTLSDPNIAYLLLMAGIAGIYFELMSPGAIFPGVIGAICLILGFFSLQTLPINYAGLLLIILAVGLFILEIKVASYGLLSVAGIISLVIGSLMLFESEAPYLRLSLSVLIGTVAVATGFFMIVAGMALRAHLRKPASGIEGMLGLHGTAKSRIDPEGKVFVHGEYWDAWSDEVIESGEPVTVIGMQGLRLKVRKSNSR